MALLSLLFFLLSFLFGYRFPRKALWFSIVAFPLLYPAKFTIVPSEVLFLNINRVVFAMVVGVHLRYGKKLHLNWLPKNSWVKIFLIFSSYVALISLNDYAKHIIFSYIPNIYTALVLGFLIIQSENDFKRVIRILTWQTLFFSLVALLGFFNVVHIGVWARHLWPNASSVQIFPGALRAGIFRTPGWDGHPIFSAVRLVVLFPVTMLNLIWSKKKIFNIIFPLLSFISIVIFMSRAAYLAFAVSMMFLFYFVFTKINKSVINKFRLLLRNIFVIVVLFVLVSVYVPFLKKTIIVIYEFSVATKTAKANEGRFARIPYAIDQFKKKPLFGYGSPHYVYFKVMDTEDIPSTVTYLLAGGIPLFILFIVWWAWMPFYFFKYLKYKFISKSDKIIIIYISSAFIGGLIPMLINRTETSLLLMLIMFVATYKYLIIRKQKMMLF